MTKLLAVYGTLRYGAVNNDQLRGCKRLGQDAIPGVIYTIGWFPGLKLIEDHDFRTVVVDVYDIPKEIFTETIKRIDRYEGYFPDALDQCLFERKTIKTINGCLDVMVYEYKWPVNEKNKVLSGDWIAK